MRAVEGVAADVTAVHEDVLLPTVAVQVAVHQHLARHEKERTQ